MSKTLRMFLFNLTSIFGTFIHLYNNHLSFHEIKALLALWLIKCAGNFPVLIHLATQVSAFALVTEITLNKYGERGDKGYNLKLDETDHHLSLFWPINPILMWR